VRAIIVSLVRTKLLPYTKVINSTKCNTYLQRIPLPILTGTPLYHFRILLVRYQSTRYNYDCSGHTHCDFPAHYCYQFRPELPIFLQHGPSAASCYSVVYQCVHRRFSYKHHQGIWSLNCSYHRIKTRPAFSSQPKKKSLGSILHYSM